MSKRSLKPLGIQYPFPIHDQSERLASEPAMSDREAYERIRPRTAPDKRFVIHALLLLALGVVIALLLHRVIHIDARTARAIRSTTAPARYQ